MSVGDLNIGGQSSLEPSSLVKFGHLGTSQENLLKSVKIFVYKVVLKVRTERHKKHPLAPIELKRGRILQSSPIFCHAEKAALLVDLL